VCHSYSDLNFGVTFLEHSVISVMSVCLSACLSNYNFRKPWRCIFTHAWLSSGNHACLALMQLHRLPIC